MSERTQSPVADCNGRSFDVNKAMYAQALSQDGLGNASLQFPHVLQDPSLLFNKSSFNGITPPPPQTFFAFPAVGGDYRASEVQSGDFTQPKHWYPFAAPEYTGQVAGTTTATQPANHSPPIAETREQIKMPEIKTEKEVNDEYATELKLQVPPPATSLTHGVYYSAPWNPSFWPGLSHIAAPSNTTAAQTIPPTASSPSLSPSPPGNTFSGVGFYNGGSAQTVPATQVQTTARSSGSSSGGCSDSEEEVSTTLTFQSTVFAHQCNVHLSVVICLLNLQKYNSNNCLFVGKSDHRGIGTIRQRTEAQAHHLGIHTSGRWIGTWQSLWWVYVCSFDRGGSSEENKRTVLVQLYLCQLSVFLLSR